MTLGCDLISRVCACGRRPSESADPRSGVAVDSFFLAWGWGRGWGVKCDLAQSVVNNSKSEQIWLRRYPRAVPGVQMDPGGTLERLSKLFGSSERIF